MSTGSTKIRAPFRLGLIARADSRGLGIQTRAVYRNLKPAKTMVVDCPSAAPLPLRRDWYPDATWIHGLPTAADFRAWLKDLDVVYTAETGYGRALWDEAERAGAKTVLHVNPEFLDISDRPSLWAAPSLWRFDELPEPKLHLPVPITPTEPRPARETATRFLHVVGRPAIHDRNGTSALLNALRHVQTPLTLTITCQDRTYAQKLVSQTYIPRHVRVDVHSGDVPDNRDLYADKDVLVLPRRFGGLCLPAQEAVGAGMPVVMPAISPNDSWLPAEWLVPASHCGEFKAKTKVQLYSADARGLAAKIDQFATDDAFYADATEKARDIAGMLSWDSMGWLYDKVFEELRA